MELDQMELDQESKLDFRVLRGQDNQWHVTAHDDRQPLASFDSPHEACDWAIARAKPKQGRVFVEETLVDYANPDSRRRPATQRRSALLTRRTGAR